MFVVDFSLGAWLASRAIASVDAVTVPQASQLLVELGLDHYLDSTDRCSLSDTVYAAAGVNGWVNGKLYNAQLSLWLNFLPIQNLKICSTVYWEIVSHVLYSSHPERLNFS